MRNVVAILSIGFVAGSSLDRRAVRSPLIIVPGILLLSGDKILRILLVVPPAARQLRN